MPHQAGTCRTRPAHAAPGQHMLHQAETCRTRLAHAAPARLAHATPGCIYHHHSSTINTASLHPETLSYVHLCDSSCHTRPAHALPTCPCTICDILFLHVAGTIASLCLTIPPALHGLCGIWMHVCCEISSIL